MTQKRLRYTIFLILLAALSTGLSMAQSQKKLEKLEQKGKYDKLISLTDKKIRKGKATGTILYYNILGNLMKTRASLGREQEKSYYDATRAYKRLERTDHGDSIQNLLKSEMQEWGKTVFDQLPESRKGKRKYYASFFAEYYGDTLDVYYTYFPVKTDDVAAEIPEAADTVSIAKVEKLKAEIRYKIPAIIPGRESIIKKSEEAMGTPWKWAGMTPGVGFDCSGFIIWTYGQFGYEFPHRTKMLAQIGTPVTLEKAKAGDLVCFGSSEYKPDRVYHVGLIHSREEGEVNMIHCGTTLGVSISPLTSGYWSEKDYFIVRIAE